MRPNQLPHYKSQTPSLIVPKKRIVNILVLLVGKLMIVTRPISSIGLVSLAKGKSA